LVRPDLLGGINDRLNVFHPTGNVVWSHSFDGDEHILSMAARRWEAPEMRRAITSEKFFGRHEEGKMAPP
jgi:hypothetical protein